MAEPILAKPSGRGNRRRAAFYVPQNLDPKTFKKGHRKYAAFFLNLLHWKWCCWQADENGYIRLKQEYLLKVIPREVWPVLLTRLVGRGIIHHSDVWDPGVRSMGYCLAPE